MFNNEEPASFKKMHEFSTVDGFVEVTENLADMIKFVANEPSVGLFYVQQHTQNAAPNLINLKNNVIEKSRETALHTEDLEDSITMVRSMKECGIPTADVMIEDIKKSLSIMSSRPSKRGLIKNSSSGFLGRTGSWSPAAWGHNAVNPQQGHGKSSGYLSSVLKSAKKRANNFKWSQVESTEASQSKDAETEDLPLSSGNGSELQDKSQLGKSLSHQQVLSLYENYDEFKADQEAKLEQWLGGMGKDEDFGGRELHRGALSQPDLVPR